MEGQGGPGTGVLTLIPVLPEGVKAGDQNALGSAPAQTRPRMRAK